MAKKARKFLVLALAAILCIMSFAIPALADDIEIENTEEILTVTTTTSTGEGGEEVVTVTIEKTEEVQTEKSEYTAEVQPGQPVPEVEVELVPGDPNGVTKTVTDTVTEVTGDLPESSDDKEFDFTSTTTTTEREVTASASEAEITVTEKDNNLTALAPDQHDSSAYGDPDKDADNDPSNGHQPAGGGLASGLTPDYLQSYADQVAKPDAEGYDFQWTGYAEATNEYRAVSKDVVYKKDADGNVMRDDNGEPIIESITFTGKYGDGMGSTPSIFTLTKYEEDGTKSYYYGYCIDNDTEAVPGAWYKVSNLEDSDYYPDDESAAKLRAIVNNGYWGQNEGQGSVEQMKAALKAYYDEDATITIEDKNGNPLTIPVYDLFDNLTEGEALTITQAAIWTHANGSVNTNDGKDGTIIETLFSVDKPKANLANTDRDYNYESDARLRAAYEWLCSIAPQSSEDDTVTTIINEKNAVEDMSLVVGGKVKDHEANEDGNDKNDVYNAGLKFTLAFTPDPETDDLLVKLIGEDGKTIKDAEGNEIIRRLVGSAKEGETEYETIAPEADGSYVLSGLQLQEGDFTFDLRLEGTQYLKEGVYIYSTEGSGADVESQTMVGIASGERDVEVNVGMTITFEVDEESKVVAERVWRKSSTSTTTTTTTTRTPSRTTTTTTIIDDEGVPMAASADELIEIIDEEVPLADAPETGDNSIIYVLMSLISLCGVSLLMIKRKEAKEN